MACLDQVVFCIAIVSAVITVVSFPAAVVNVRPVHTIVIVFVACGATLVTVGKLYPVFFSAAEDRSDYSSIPLNSGGLTQTTRKTSSKLYSPLNGQPKRVPKRILLFTVLALASRVDLYRRTSGATECTGGTIEVCLPFLVSVYDCVRFQSTRVRGEADVASDGHATGRSAILRQIVLRSRMRYMLPAFLFSLGSWLLLRMWDGINSTYICPIVVKEARSIPSVQLFAVLLDASLAAATVELAHSKGNTNTAPSAGRPFVWGFTFFAAAAIWACVGVGLYFAKPEWRASLAFWELVFNFEFSISLFLQVLILTTLCISTLHCIILYGVLSMTMVLTALCVLIPSLRLLWSFGDPFPQFSAWVTATAFFFIYVGWSLFTHLRQMSGDEKRNSIIHQVAILAISLCLVSLLLFKGSSVESHPIDGLMKDAKLQQQMYLKGATRGHTLQDAVVEYKRRYSMRPPPSFDVWYQYAINTSTTIIDDFDQIYDDLLPFRMISPVDLRRQTWEMVSNPWNEISGITIRAGVATVQENVLPTHRWMLEGVAILINAFAEHLPDMDLAFNLNDESRVAVPFADLLELRDNAQKVKLAGHGVWSTDRSEQWLPISVEDYRETVFRDLSFRNTFSRYGSIGCAPGSKARRVKHVPSQSHICVECAAPHSEGQFLSNWSLAADVCHQPDLAHLHGFYSSPAAFKTSHQLVPVFSQSKAHGYNDILYPSAWNYMEKAVYAPTEPSGEHGTDTYQPGFPDPDFLNKNDVLFWRGATSEGVSSGDHTWRGMTRQRLVHMANNLTSSRHDYVTILLPGKKGKLMYQTISGPSVRDLGLKTDIAIVDHIARCGGIGLHDCTDQEKEFALLPPSDFQSHWKYRYLFDLDGAAFSGRFLPFLQSKSLPFKTALFREWYDSRLIAWRHFVPQDLRLHGVWSTLAYFAGVNGTVHGRKYEMAPHLKEAETIATAGREWASKVLRKEDMELYFFRLLLEWGRLTDDRREELGFSI